MNVMLINRKTTHFVCCMTAILLGGCGLLQEKNADQQPVYVESVVTKPNEVKDKLYTQFNKWQGVRYRLGGSSKKGIDCSAFVQITFKSKFGVHLPRTTHLQSRLGKKISKYELEAGDLVFFRTGSNSRHVGIYLEGNKFLHASRRRGVTISKLDNVYWKANYWKSIRI